MRSYGTFLTLITILLKLPSCESGMPRFRNSVPLKPSDYKDIQRTSASRKPLGPIRHTVRFGNALPAQPLPARSTKERASRHKRAKDRQGTARHVVNCCFGDTKSDRPRLDACDGHRLRCMSF